MFGYILFSKANSTNEEFKAYRSHYCGLCHVLKEKYGKKGMMSLSYDMVFLEMLLSDLYDQERTEISERCTVRPARKHKAVYTNATTYAADMEMLLYYYSLLDNAYDEKKDIKKAEEYREAAERVSREYPAEAKAIKEGLIEIHEEEEKNSKDYVHMASIFGKILGEIFVWKKNDFFAPELRAIGEALGRYIYIIDAWCDKEKDKKKGIYNPLPENMSKDEVSALLTEYAASATDIFERLPLDEYVPLMRNILYSGIWVKYDLKKEGKND